LKKYGFLEGIRIFSGLNSRELQRIGKKFKLRTVDPNELILMAEEAGNTFFVIASGKVKISVLSKEGKEVIFSTLEKGDFFGEMSLLDGKKRSADVSAVERSELYVLSREDFLAILEESPKIAIKIMEELAKRMRRADQQIKSLALLDVYGRVAGTLIQLAEDRGKKVKEGTVISDRPNHQEMANMAGTSRETVTRVLGDLKLQGFIDIDEKNILILNEKRLVEDYVF
jgi:CRP/FNR family transcriptional regulator/CRP/FNR family cyclic AMP-dependent transcriptional regulator